MVPYPAGPDGADTYLAPSPDWGAMIPPAATDVPDDWHFLSVDGGATDNEPIELARTALAGLLGRNPRDAATANRAVWLIDPFAGRAALGPAGLTTLPERARRDRHDPDPADPLRHRRHPDGGGRTVFSRFMLSPMRAGLTGGDAIASGGLGAFIGFACPDFMRFDYLLGRANCQAYPSRRASCC